MGQFTQQDPIGIAGGLNLYGYANGDPVNFSDPFGLRAEGNPCEGIEDLDEWAECKRNQYEQEDARREFERSVRANFSIGRMCCCDHTSQRLLGARRRIADRRVLCGRGDGRGGRCRYHGSGGGRGGR